MYYDKETLQVEALVAGILEVARQVEALVVRQVVQRQPAYTTIILLTKGAIPITTAGIGVLSTAKNVEKISFNRSG